MAQTVSYHGIRPSDPHGREGLRNPERGLWVETLFAEPPGKPSPWGDSRPHHLRRKVPDGYNDQTWILDAQRYETHGLTLVQTYCYLDEFVGKLIPEQKLALLQQSFDHLRKNGLKSVLRFAYEKDTDRKSGPTLSDILNHIGQLAPVIRKNADIIFVMQAGFVGAWGEWHSSTHGLENDPTILATIVAKTLSTLPAGRMVLVRVPKYKRAVLSEPELGGFQMVDEEIAHTGAPAARIGFHDDGFLASLGDGTWPEPPYFANAGNPEFDYMTAESPYVPVGGELYWADVGGKVDGLRAAIRMRLHHYSCFSLSHSFSEREGWRYSIDGWMQAPLTVGQVREARLPMSDGYFEDAARHKVTRTQFEYIRDHLGYRLELQRATFPQEVRSGEGFAVEVALINRGFSAIHNPRPVYFVLTRDTGVVELPTEDADPRQWQPYQPNDPEYRPLVHKFAIKTRLPAGLKAGKYRLGLWMPDAYPSLHLDPRYAVRVANRDVPWWTDANGRYGVNLLGEVRITPQQPGRQSRHPKLPAPTLQTISHQPSTTRENPVDGAEMVWIPGGTFRMGSNKWFGAQPVHAQSVRGFWMYRKEVTNAQFSDFLNSLSGQLEARGGMVNYQGEPICNLVSAGYEGWQDRIRRNDGKFSVAAGYESHPVVLMTWYGALAYSKWARGRLPTEAEWEYAARGGKQLIYGTATGEISHDLANYGDGNFGKDQWSDTAPVGSFPASPFGLYDMAGNVWEWCSTLYQWYPYSATDGREDLRADVVRGGRVVRGGGWRYDNRVITLHTAFRECSSPGGCSVDIGFRVVVEGESP